MAPGWVTNDLPSDTRVRETSRRQRMVLGYGIMRDVFRKQDERARAQKEKDMAKFTSLGGAEETSNFGTFNPNTIAEVIHEAVRVVQRFAGEEVSPAWADAPSWMKVSTEEGVSVALGGATPRELHENWMRTRIAQGWVYGPIKIVEEKISPALVDYDELPYVQKVKDSLFYNIVQALTGSDPNENVTRAIDAGLATAAKLAEPTPEDEIDQPGEEAPIATTAEAAGDVFTQHTDAEGNLL